MRELTKTLAEDGIRAKQDWVIQQFVQLKGTKDFLGDEDPRKYFTLDGGVLLPKKYLFQLKEPFRSFLANGRIAIAPRYHVYRSNISGASLGASGTHIRSLHNEVSLRGLRQNEVDGKYEWGPNEEPALDLLKQNLQDNLNIVEVTCSRAVLCKEDWLLKVGILEYIRNDLYTALYFFKNKAIIQGNPQDEIVQICQEMVTFVSVLYFDALLNKTRDYDFSCVQEKGNTIIGELENGRDFLKGYAKYDLLRAHREIGNPQCLMFAARLMKTGRLKNLDTIISPLFGALDIVEALRYLSILNQTELEELGISVEDATIPQIILVAPKLMPRGPSRSKRLLLEGYLDALPGEISLLDLNQLNGSDVEKIKQAIKIGIVDDTYGRGGTQRTLRDWILKVRDGNEAVVTNFAAHATTRWADNQLPPDHRYETLTDLEPIASTPLVHNFLKPASSFFETPYMPDQLRAMQMFETDRVLGSADDLFNLIENYRELKIIDGIAIDVSVLIEVSRTMGNLNKLNNLINIGIKVTVLCTDSEKQKIKGLSLVGVNILYVCTGEKPLLEMIRTEKIKPGQILYVGANLSETIIRAKDIGALPALYVLTNQYQELIDRVTSFKSFNKTLIADIT